MTRSQKKWVYGLVSGFLGGFWSSVDSGLAVMVIGPKEFNLDDKLGKTLIAMGVLGVLAGSKIAAAYLKQSPLPPLNGDTEMFNKGLHILITLSLAALWGYAKINRHGPQWTPPQVAAAIHYELNNPDWVPTEQPNGNYLVRTFNGRLLWPPVTKPNQELK